MWNIACKSTSKLYYHFLCKASVGVYISKPAKVHDFLLLLLRCCTLYVFVIVAKRVDRMLNAVRMWHDLPILCLKHSENLFSRYTAADLLCGRCLSNNASPFLNLNKNILCAAGLSVLVRGGDWWRFDSRAWRQGCRLRNCWGRKYIYYLAKNAIWMGSITLVWATGNDEGSLATNPNQSSSRNGSTMNTTVPLDKVQPNRNCAICCLYMSRVFWPIPIAKRVLEHC